MMKKIGKEQPKNIKIKQMTIQFQKIQKNNQFSILKKVNQTSKKIKNKIKKNKIKIIIIIVIIINRNKIMIAKNIIQNMKKNKKSHLFQL